MNSNPRYVVGIDYSMTCPAAVCVDINKIDSFEDTQILYVFDSKKNSPLKNIQAVPSPKKDNQQERFDFLSQIFIQWIEEKTSGDVTIWMEDYAFAARGKVFHIGENTGLLKHYLWKHNMKFNVVPPTVIKQYATGKGNADKVKMYESFVDKTNTDLKSIYKSTMNSIGSPFGDIADAYFIAQYGASQLLCQKH